MMVRSPRPSDWRLFDDLASSEGWRVPGFERQLFEGPWSQWAHVIDDNGFCGLVTAVDYEMSAWVGNLIVPGGLRGKGYGSCLFKDVLAKLLAKGLSTVWLTASKQGRAIYAREGFVVVDCIERWVLPPSSRSARTVAAGNKTTAELQRADCLAWNEKREPLISAISRRGEVFAAGEAVALLQRWPDLQMIGPWYAPRGSWQANRELLQKVMAAIDPSVEVVVDLFGSSSLGEMCKAAGFMSTGQTTLMAHGEIGTIDLPSMVSLASLGSIG